MIFVSLLFGFGMAEHVYVSVWVCFCAWRHSYGKHIWLKDLFLLCTLTCSNLQEENFCNFLMSRDELPLHSSYEMVYGEGLLSGLPADVLGCNLVAVLQQLRLLMREAARAASKGDVSRVKTREAKTSAFFFLLLGAATESQQGMFLAESVFGNHRTPRETTKLVLWFPFEAMGGGVRGGGGQRGGGDFSPGARTEVCAGRGYCLGLPARPGGPGSPGAGRRP